MEGHQHRNAPNEQSGRWWQPRKSLKPDDLARARLQCGIQRGHRPAQQKQTLTAEISDVTTCLKTKKTNHQCIEKCTTEYKHKRAVRLRFPGLTVEVQCCVHVFRQLGIRKKQLCVISESPTDNSFKFEFSKNHLLKITSSADK